MRKRGGVFDFDHDGKKSISEMAAVFRMFQAVMGENEKDGEMN